MKYKATKKNIFSRRTALLAGGKILLGTGLLGRMYYLQVNQSRHYATLAKENSIKLEPLPPGRGLILDRFGKKLTVNNKVFRAVLIPEQVQDMEGTLAKLDHLIGIDPHSWEKALHDIERVPGFIPVTVKTGLTWDEVSTIAVHSPNLPGVTTSEGYLRRYPFGPTAAHITGYVQSPSIKEVSESPMYSLPDFKIGKTGIEKSTNAYLQGKSGYREVEVNARRRIIRQLNHFPSRAGKNINLSIDVELQGFVNQRLAQEKSASAVVMDIHSGEVLALSSHPTFDPNPFITGVDHQEWQSLITDPYKPLLNKSIAGEYSPGSIFKLVVAIAALEYNLITPSSTVTCNGFVEVGNQRFHCPKLGGHGNVNIFSAIKRSCDIFFYDLALQLGIRNIAKVARKLGLGSATGIELAEEKPGLIPDKAWKQKRFGTSWKIGETVIAGIGQGYMLATPMQLAMLIARITNGGLAVSPTLMKSPGDPYDVHSLGLKPSTLATIVKGMQQVVNSRGGTAYNARIDDPNFAMGGKTCSAQVRRITMQERKQGLHKLNLPWHHRDHALFAGFAPISKPKYAVSVVVEHGGWGGRVAAPIARDILLQTQKTYART